MKRNLVNNHACIVPHNTHAVIYYFTASDNLLELFRKVFPSHVATDLMHVVLTL